MSSKRDPGAILASHFAPLTEAADAAAPSFGQFLHNMLGGPEPAPGPPYTHTLVPPEPEYDDAGNEVWQPEPPTYTLTETPLADLVDPARPAWLARAAASVDALAPLREITRRTVAAPAQISVGEPFDGGDEFRWKP